MEGIKMKKVLSIVFLFAISFVGFGQEDVILVSQGDRIVEKAYRIARTPLVIDTIIPTVIVEYPLLILKHETQTELERINPASIKTVEKLPQLYNTYVKLGIGTKLMPLGEVYYDSDRSRKYMYGAHVKHLSSFGDIKNYAKGQYDRTKLGIYGGLNETRYTIRGDFHYGSQGFHYYGISDTLNIPGDSIAQRYSDVGFSGKFITHIKDSAKVNFSVGIAYNNYHSKKSKREEEDLWRARENFFGVTTSTWYKHRTEIYGLDVDIRYNGYRYGEKYKSLTGLDTGLFLNNTIVDFRPHITTRLQNDRFKAKVGVDVAIDVRDVTRAYIFPIAEVKYSLFNDIFIPYIGARGGIKQTTFKSLTGENEFLLPNVELRNENTAFDFYGGIKGTISRRISFNAAISFAKVKDKALFVTDTIHSPRNKFNVIYDTMNVTTIEGSISYQLMEKLKIDAIGKFYSYVALNNSYAWNLPRLEIMLRGSYNLFDKFIFNLDLKMEEGRKALVYAPGTGISEENGQYIENLKFLADLNLGVEYRYNKRISAFVQFNNIAAQQYMRWHNTPVQGFQFLGGVTYRF